MGKKNTLPILALVAGSIVFYSHIIPILDGLVEVAQVALLTKKMKVNIAHAKYEKMVNNILSSNDDAPTQRAIGFQASDDEESSEDEED